MLKKRQAGTFFLVGIKITLGIGCMVIFLLKNHEMKNNWIFSNLNSFLYLINYTHTHTHTHPDSQFFWLPIYSYVMIFFRSVLSIYIICANTILS